MLPSEKKIYSIDYSEITDKGFFLTESNSVSFDYTAIGSVSSYYRSGKVYINSKKASKSENDDVYRTTGSIKKIENTNVVYYTPKDALIGIYEEALKMGGNGIINFRIDYISLPNLPHNYGYSVSGMVIKK